MANVPISYRNADVHGVPAFEVLDTYTDANLLCTAEPAVLKPTRILLGDNLTLKQFAVVGLAGTGAARRLVMATQGDSGVVPIGVLFHAAASGANNTTMFGEVSLGGDYNTGINDAGDDSPLVWDASFTTREQKNRSVIGNPNLRFGTRLVGGAA